MITKRMRCDDACIKFFFWNEYKSVFINSLITTFYLDGILFKDQDGGKYRLFTSNFSPEEKQLLEKNILLVKLLKETTCLSLFEDNGTEQLNEAAIDESINRTKSLELMA